METVTIRTPQREAMVNITAAVQKLVATKGWYHGALLAFCPHTTASLTINEAADPDVEQDMVAFMHRRIPATEAFRHGEGNSDAHIKASLFGAHSLIIVEQGTLRLGTWQGLYLCEWDGPRTRNVWLQFLPGGQEGKRIP